jgi:cytochrome c oxidase cbb3-type subunit 4
MNAYSIVSIATTVLMFFAFLGIVAWAYSGGRKREFDEAANAPFALPDEFDAPAGGNDNPGERRS